MNRWLCQAAADPQTAVEDWKAGRATRLSAGVCWDLARVDFRLARTVPGQLRDNGHHIGPYLASGVERAIWWLLPLGTGYRLTGASGVTVYDAGAELLAPAPGKYLGDRLWILPDRENADRNALTSAEDLRAALEAAAPVPAPLPVEPLTSSTSERITIESGDYVMDTLKAAMGRVIGLSGGMATLQHPNGVMWKAFTTNVRPLTAGEAQAFLTGTRAGPT